MKQCFKYSYYWWFPPIWTTTYKICIPCFCPITTSTCIFCSICILWYSYCIWFFFCIWYLDCIWFFIRIWYFYSIWFFFCSNLFFYKFTSFLYTSMYYVSCIWNHELWFVYILVSSFIKYFITFFIPINFDSLCIFRFQIFPIMR